MLAAIGAGPAAAATIAGGSTITVTSGPESEDFYAYEDTNDIVFERNSTAAPALSATGTCSGTAGQVTCPRANIVANLGSGDDQAGFGGVGLTTVEVHAGPGNDSIEGSPGADQIFGDEDTDYINGREGADSVNGGAGNDSFARLIGADSVFGGDGGDTIEFFGAPAAVFVSLDDVANDGPESARTANVHADVEAVQGSEFDDHLVGNIKENELHGNKGNDEVIGGGGAFDTLRGDDGNDTLDSVNDFEDDLGCGAGIDAIRIDPRDKVDDCENVTVVGPDNDGDGSKPPIDCDDNNAAVKPGGNDIPGNGLDEDCSGADAPLLDADQDGVTDEKDCDDGNKAIRPGAVDKPGNGIDEDCDGADDPYPVVVGTVAVLFSSSRAGMRITLLRITGAQAGARVQVRCRGRGCPFARRSLRLRRGRVVGTRLFRGRRLRPGAVFELRLTATDTIGKVRRLTVRRGGRFRQQSLCLKPGKRSPSAC